MWVHPERVAQCEPADVGWFSHSNPFEFDIHHFEYAPDALRFWGGTPSVAPALIAAHSIERLIELGLDKIEAHNRELGEMLCKQVDGEFLVSPVDPAQRGATVVLNFRASQDRFAERLKAAGVQFDTRKEGIRLSPHFYNNADDMQRVLECVPGR
jgi:selenocysteine lyase/cysteine desulfurase